MRKLTLIVMLATASVAAPHTAFSQSIADGPISLDVRLQEIDVPLLAEDEAAFGAAFATEEFTFDVWARDMPNLDGSDWLNSATCLQADLVTPAATAPFDTPLMEVDYAGREIPASVDVRLDGWEDEAGDSVFGQACRSERCDFETSFCCGFVLAGICIGDAEADDSRLNAAPFFSDLDYRQGRACSTFDHGLLEGPSVGTAFRPRIVTSWQYLDGDEATEAHDMGTVDSSTPLLHRDGLGCYTDTNAGNAGPDAFTRFTTGESGALTLSVCGAGDAELDVVFTGPAGDIASSTSCATPITRDVCFGESWTLRVDGAAAEEFDIAAELEGTGADAALLCCGDTVIDANEGCDDGAETTTCNLDCSVSVCGDSVLNVSDGETCDDGTATATCDTDCSAAVCGDGIRNPAASEACDDGANNGLPLGCALDCSGLTPAACGNGVIETGEACDDAGESDTCNADCSPAQCGDGTLNPTAGELCDDAGATAACDTDCTPALCGDGRVNVAAGEACDDAGESPACDNDCSVSRCGDGTTNTTAGETCDDVGASATCDTDCSAVTCGDAIVNAAAGEVCDDGGSNGQPLRCASNCSGLTAGICGNGVVESGEFCDDAGESVDCNVDCTRAQCGDGTTNTTAGEICDDAGATVACDADCTTAICGDGTVNVAAGEGCDDRGESAACDADCSVSRCGDGIINNSAGEACDDAGSSATCNLDCSVASCGDGVINAAAGEVCDDGARNGDPLSCAADCGGVTAAVCGNGVPEVGESCDDAGESLSCDDDCSDTVCGDGATNATAGELCDDGGNNGTPGACAADCLGITDAVCGNGVLEAGERCDDAGPTNECDADCTFTECGDGVRNATAGEACDDGTNNGEPRGCAVDCGGLTPSVCGNGVSEAGEFCDTSGDSAACDSNCTEALCGDGTLNAAALELCDDGAANGEPLACAANCQGTTAAICGNGVAEAGEECDARGFSLACDGDCTVALCGDGVVNESAGEACDDSNDEDTDTCLNNCSGASCGDGIVWDSVEACDDGVDNGTPGRCSLDCSGTTPASCGNGALEAGETCDDAGASATCDPDCTGAICGDGFVNAAAAEACDDGPRNGEPFACNAACTASTVAVCGNGVAEAGERCDDAGESAACDADCSDAICGDGTINLTSGETCDDRGLSGTCDDDCTAAACGDALFNPAAGESCDDGNLDEEDGCLRTCVAASCGDGIIWADIEICDDGDDNGTPGFCALDCAGVTSATCGNGSVEDGEFCDGGDDCDPDCSEVRCGDGFANAIADETCDDGPRNGEPLACAVDCSGPTLGVCGNGVTEPGENCDDAGDSASCNADCRAALCGDGMLNEASGERCDDGSVNGEALACAADCSGPTTALCGNGVIEAGEVCDEGTQTDLCNSDCTSALCGDGVINAEAGESCDDGNDVDTDDCNTLCASAACGDGVVWEGVEVCDDGEANGTPSLCALDCLGVTPATCGNGTLEDGEACDDGAESDVCDADCSLAECGDGFTNVTAGEVCDDSVLNGEPLACADDCSGTTVPVCGNSVVEVGEQCDGGEELADCDDDCSRPVCGDGIVNTAAGEQCDPGDDPTCRFDCSGVVAEPEVDAGTDAGDAGDAGVDTGSDAGSDGGDDAGSDAGDDAGSDAGDDGGLDGSGNDDVTQGDSGLGGDGDDYNVGGGGGCSSCTGAGSAAGWLPALCVGLLLGWRRRQLRKR
ncbi:MAG: cysteine-rich repeat protein [Flavobacteriales bacterium]|jgi:cysteine-rich repeat protein